ncbi:transmembrane protein, putative [Bodo saltans]|uniref:Transmembrane protein, putative n=1 Tax=Bodo saltans TaxID=75058 RepID=A0A0S4J8S3_BODSA|nr:transmembrane protein, putative [Bodo saltans]|eukprot:CUG85803.1 transmembrane protein, putative [Bodo saltans]
MSSLGPYLSKLPPWAVPSGRWLPQSCAATHGRARSAVIGGQEWLSEYAVVYTVAMNFVSGLPLSATKCGVVFGVACIIPLTGLVAMIWRRPCRVPLLTWLNVLQYLLSFLTMLLTSLLRAGISSVDKNVLPGFSLALNCVTMSKMTGNVVAQLWEARFNQNNLDDQGTLPATADSPSLHELIEKDDFSLMPVDLRRCSPTRRNSFKSSAATDVSSSSKKQSCSSESLSRDQQNSLEMLLQLCCERSHSLR